MTFFHDDTTPECKKEETLGGSFIRRQHCIGFFTLRSSFRHLLGLATHVFLFLFVCFSYLASGLIPEVFGGYIPVLSLASTDGWGYMDLA